MTNRGSVNINFFRVRKSAKNGVKQRLAEISGAGGEEMR